MPFFRGSSFLSNSAARTCIYARRTSRKSRSPESCKRIQLGSTRAREPLEQAARGDSRRLLFASARHIRMRIRARLRNSPPARVPSIDTRMYGVCDSITRAGIRTLAGEKKNERYCTECEGVVRRARRDVRMRLICMAQCRGTRWI